MTIVRTKWVVQIPRPSYLIATYSLKVQPDDYGKITWTLRDTSVDYDAKFSKRCRSVCRNFPEIFEKVRAGWIHQLSPSSSEQAREPWQNVWWPRPGDLNPSDFLHARVCYLYINTLRENLFSPLGSQIIVVFYERLHVHFRSSPSSIPSISQHFSSPTDKSEDFLFENGNRRRSKCIGDQSARSSSTRGWELGTVRGLSIDRVTVRASGRVARWFFDSWIFHVTRLVWRLFS